MTGSQGERLLSHKESINHSHTCLSHSGPQRARARTPARASNPTSAPQTRGDLGHITSLSFSICTVRSQRGPLWHNPGVSKPLQPLVSAQAPGPVVPLAHQAGPPSSNPTLLTSAPASTLLSSCPPGRLGPGTIRAQSWDTGHAGPAPPLLPGSGQVPRLTFCPLLCPGGVHGGPQGGVKRQGEGMLSWFSQPRPTPSQSKPARSTGEERARGRRPEQHTNTCPSWGCGVFPCGSVFTRKKGQRPKEATRLQASPEGMSHHLTTHSCWAPGETP